MMALLHDLVPLLGQCNLLDLQQFQPQPELDRTSAEDAKPPVAERDDSMEHHEIWVDGVGLDTNSL